MNLNCPICKKDDQVRRLKSIVEEGVTDTESSTFGVQSSIMSGSISSISGAYSLISGISSGILSALTKGKSKTRLSNTLSPPPAPNKKAGPILSAIAFMILGAILYLLFVLLTPINYNSNAFLIVLAVSMVWGVIKGKKNQKIYNEELNFFMKKYEIWSRLYYCKRDHCVFDPITGICDDADNIESIYYALLESKTPSLEKT